MKKKLLVISIILETTKKSVEVTKIVKKKFLSIQLLTYKENSSRSLESIIINNGYTTIL